MLPQWLISVNVQSQIGSLHAQCHFVPIVSCLDLHHSFTFQDIKVTNHFQHVILFVCLFFSIGTKELLPFYHAKELDVGVSWEAYCKNFVDREFLFFYNISCSKHLLLLNTYYKSEL